MAGINAHLKTKNEPPFILKRSEAYIGVLIDDLISKGTKEPYRMFTSRAEFRTLLRQDNADLRLTEMSYKMGLASQERMNLVTNKRAEVRNLKLALQQFSLMPEDANQFLAKIGSAEILEKQKLDKIILRPNLGLMEMGREISSVAALLESFSIEAVKQTEIQIKYRSYIDKEAEQVAKMKQMEELEISEQFDYQRIMSLGVEAREKLNKVKPRTLGQASRISGINPTDVQILMVFMGR